MRCNPYHSLQQQSNQQSKHFSHVSESLPSSPLLLPLSLLLLLLLLVLHLLNQPSLLTTMIQLWIFSSSSSLLLLFPIPSFCPFPANQCPCSCSYFSTRSAFHKFIHLWLSPTTFPTFPNLAQNHFFHLHLFTCSPHFTNIDSSSPVCVPSVGALVPPPPCTGSPGRPLRGPPCPLA